MTPGLKQSFVLSYVLLAPLVGAFADSMPKGQVMLITNGIKIVGCMLMLITCTRSPPTPWWASAPPPIRRPSTGS